MLRPPALLAGLLLVLPALAAAQPVNEITATILADRIDPDLADNFCDVDPVEPDFDHDDDPATPPLGQCSLRAAIQTANASPEPDRILLRPATYILSLAGSGEDAAATGDLDVTSAIEIEGIHYQSSFIDAGKTKDRIFDVQPGGDLTLTNTSLLFGRTAKEDFDPGSMTEVSGGCVRSAGELTLDDTFFFRCASSDDGGGVSVLDGHATISDSIFSSCRARNEGGAIEVGALGDVSISRVTAGACRAGSGGAIATRGMLALSNGTLVLNKAKFGGALAVLGSPNVTIVHSTLASNRSDNLASEPGSNVTVSNSIVSGTEIDCLGALASGGGNLEGATSCGFTGTNDQQNTDPLLLPLQFNGGPIPTAGLGPESPAIDHAIDAPDVCNDAGDARTRLRTDHTITVNMVEVDVGLPGVHTDVGAFEVSPEGGSELAISSTPVTSATVGSLYTYDVEATNKGREGCALTFSLALAPDGMTIDPTTGVISWTPTAEQEELPQAVNVRVAEGGAQDTQAFAVHVEPSP